MNDQNKDDRIFKGDNSRFVDYSFGNVSTQSLDVNGSFSLSGVALGKPVDGGTVTVPTRCSVVLLQSDTPYTQLTVKMPIEPTYGQVLTIITTVDIPNLDLTGADFGTVKPIGMLGSVPLKFIYIDDKWFAC